MRIYHLKNSPISCVLFIFIAIIIIFHFFSRIKKANEISSIVLHPSDSTYSIRARRGWHEGYSSTRGNKLVTLCTTFVDILTEHSPHEMSYRYTVQRNFLSTTQFDAFREHINFIVYTDSKFWSDLISLNYPTVNVLSIPQPNQFTAPLLKSLLITSMQVSDTYFYMFANGDNLYDYTLLSTLIGVREYINSHSLRSSVMIIGHRFDLPYKEVVKNENQIETLMSLAVIHMPIAKDYFIVTKDTLDWYTFPDFIIGRPWFDNFLVEFSFHNEIELIDATETINLIHQIKMHGYWSSMHSNVTETAWNRRLHKYDCGHSSIYCARYSTLPWRGGTDKLKRGLVLYNKKSRSIIRLPSEVFYSQIVRSVQRMQYVRSKIPNLILIIFACNKPESLTRLLESLSAIRITDHKSIDLIIQLDIGHTGTYDVDVLKVIQNFKWLYGAFGVHMRNNHAGKLNMWLQEWVIPESETHILLLEDTIVVSSYFFEILYLTLKYVESRNIKLAGISIDYGINDTLMMNTVNSIKRGSAILLSDFIGTNAFLLIPDVWTSFLSWVTACRLTCVTNTQLLDTPVAKLLGSDRTFNNWTQYMFPIWFGYYLKVYHPNLPVGYLIHSAGAIASTSYYAANRRLRFCYSKGHFKLRYPILTNISTTTTDLNQIIMTNGVS